MADSPSTAIPEAAKATSTAHPPVQDMNVAAEMESDRTSIMGDRAMRAIGGGSPEAPPEGFAGALGQMPGDSQVGMMRQLQRSYGNSYVGRVIQAKTPPTKVTVPAQAPPPLPSTQPITVSAASLAKHVTPPVDNSVRAARAQRAAESIREREYRQLAERDRPLEPVFDWKPLGDPDHVAELAGHPLLDDLADIQVLNILASDEPVAIPVRFASLAWGTIWIAGSIEGLQTFHTPQPNVIRLDHPGLPSLDDSHIPALLVEVYGGVVFGEIVTVSNQLSMGPPGSGFRRIDTANISRVMALEDLQNLRIGAVENELGAGHLTFHVKDMSYDLDGVFPGHGHFGLDDERHILTANADIEAKGVKRQTVSVARDNLGQIRARADNISSELITPEGHKLAGKLQALFERGVFDIRGTVTYSAGDIARGQVTLLITDEATAWAAVRQRLGHQAPPVTESTGAPHGLAFIGWGDIDFKVNEWLTGTGEVVLDPDGYVTALGQLRPTKVLTLFPLKASKPRNLITPEKHSVIVPVFEIPVELAATLTLKAHSSVGSATLSNIAVDGLFTTRPHQPSEFRISGIFAFPASAQVDLVAKGSVSLPSILSHLGSLEAEIDGNATLSAHALITPHIGRRSHGTDPSKASYYIGGRFNAAAALSLGLDGGVYINPPIFPRFSIISFKSKRWQIGLGSISVKGTYVLGHEDNETSFHYTPPDVETGPIWTAMTGRSASGIEEGQADKEEIGGQWKDEVSVSEMPHAESVTPPADQASAAVAVPSAAQAGASPALPPAPTSVPGPGPSGPAGPTSVTVPSSIPQTPPPSATPTSTTPATPAPTQTNPPPPATPAPAPTGSAPAPKAPPIAETFVMVDTPNELLLVRAPSPYIVIAKPSGGRLEVELGVAKTVIRHEYNAAVQGASPDYHGADELSDELEFLESLVSECRKVEARASTEALHPTQRVTGFYDLAEQLSTYGSLFGRKVLPRSMQPPSPATVPTPPAAQPPPLTLGTALAVNKPAGQVRGVFVGYGEDIFYESTGTKDRAVKIKIGKQEQRFGFKGYGTIWFVLPVGTPPAVHYSSSKFPFIHQNIQNAIARRKPTRLNYLQDDAQAKANRRAALAGHKPAKSGFWLDEYPFASTYQGGDDAEVMEVPIPEQRSQAGLMSSFYQKYKLQDGDEFDVLV